MGLLKNKDAILFKNDGAITNGASTYLRVKPVFAGTASYATHSGGATVIWDRTNSPVPYDWWIAHDVFTGPYTTTSVSGLRAGSEGFTAAYIDPSAAGNLTTQPISNWDIHSTRQPLMMVLQFTGTDKRTFQRQPLL